MPECEVIMRQLVQARAALAGKTDRCKDLEKRLAIMTTAHTEACDAMAAAEARVTVGELQAWLEQWGLCNAFALRCLNGNHSGILAWRTRTAPAADGGEDEGTVKA